MLVEASNDIIFKNKYKTSKNRGGDNKKQGEII